VVSRMFSVAGSKGLTSSTEYPGTTHVWVIAGDTTAGAKGDDAR
jgi:hypothetical protein